MTQHTHMTEHEAKVLVACLWLGTVPLKLIGQTLGYEPDEDGSTRIANLIDGMIQKKWINYRSLDLRPDPPHDTPPPIEFTLDILTIRQPGVDVLGGLEFAGHLSGRFQDTLAEMLDRAWHLLQGQRSGRIN